MTDDRSFDRELHQTAHGLDAPPPDILSHVDPWRKAMGGILWGMALNAIRFNVLYLQYLLPALGVLLMYLGMRTLRRVNRPFHLCGGLSLALLATKWVALGLSALPLSLPAWWAFVLDTCAALLIEAFFLSMRAGIRTVWADHGETPPNDPLLGAAVLYPVFVFCALFLSHLGLVVALPFLIAFFLLLRGLWKAASALDGMGYDLEAAPVRVSAKWLHLLWWGSLAAVLLISSLCLTRPTQVLQPMDGLIGQAEEIRADLLDLGFPEVLLDDLPAPELSLLAGADSVQVVGQTQSGSNPTPYVTNWHGTVEAICVAVGLSDTETRLYFWQRWLDRPTLQLQEGFSIEPGGNIVALSDLTGQVVIDGPEGKLTAPLTRLEIATAQNDSILFGQSSYRGVVGSWSLPLEGELPRCWVGVTCNYSEELYVWGAVFNIRHQDSLLNFPYESAYDFCLRGGWDEGAFSTFNMYFNLWSTQGLVAHSRNDAPYVPAEP